MKSTNSNASKLATIKTRVNKVFFLLAFILLPSISAVGQSQQAHQEADRLFNEAVALANSGNNEQAAITFRRAIDNGLDIMDELYATTFLRINDYTVNRNFAALYAFLGQFNHRTAEQYSTMAYAAVQLGRLGDANRLYARAFNLDNQVRLDFDAFMKSYTYVRERDEREEAARLQRQAEEARQRAEAEARRVAAIRGAQIGDRLFYSETWQWREGWFVVSSGTFTMRVVLFVERIEGDRFQLRVGDIQSTDNRRWENVTINGVRVNRGDIIWARPLEDQNFVFGG